MQISLYKDDVFISYLDLIQINFTTFEQEYNFTENGSYEIRIESGKFISNLYGQTQQMSLDFRIKNGDYSSIHYSNDYLTN